MAHIIERLRQDHEAVMDYFERIRQSVDGSVENRRELYEALGRAFSAQTAFEEAVFYPALREGDEETVEGTTLLISEAIDEHHKVLELLERINAMEPGDPEYFRAGESLERALCAHIEREEQEIFPLAERVIDRDQAEEMTVHHDAMVWGNT